MGKKEDNYLVMTLFSPFSNNVHIFSRDIQFFCLGIISTLLLTLMMQQLSPGLLCDNSSNLSSGAVVVSDSTLRSAVQRVDPGNLNLPIPMDPFPEPPWRTAQTISARTITSTPFARFEIHQVRTESGVVVNDWLWTDERSHVNILIHLKEEDKYLLFYQKKYGLEKPYYAAIGGLFDAGDTPDGCARRELLEETGLEAEEMVNLGRYRVQVNRGGGILHAFLAKNAYPSKKFKKSDDYEKQEKKLLTRKELLDVVLKGEIGEAQWLATIALGLVYEEHLEHHGGPKPQLSQ